MNLVRFDPFRDLEALHQNVNRLFQDALGDQKAESGTSRLWAPLVDVAEDDEKIVVKAELPGMKREDIDVEMNGDTLTIKGERKFESEEKKENYIRVERAYGTFQRSFTIGVPVQTAKVKASYKDGVLEVAVPKAEEVKPKKIDVKVE